MSHISKGDVHAYLDGALGAYSEDAARHIREHLDTCRDCAQLLEGERRVRQEASAILAASAKGPVELDPLEELLARAADSDRQQAAEGSERMEKARPWVGSRLSSLRWAATVVISLGAGWMANGLTRPASDVARGAATGRVATESVLPPVADQERLERDNAVELAEAETLPESRAAAAGRLAEAETLPESQVAAARELAETETPPESPSAVAVGGANLGGDRGARGFDGDAVLDQVQAPPVRQRAASAVASGAVPDDASVRAEVAEPPVGTARLSDDLRSSALSISAPDADRQDGASPLNVAPGASASASLSATPFLVPGLPVRDVRVAPEADSLAGWPGGLVVVTQELEDGRVIELRFVRSGESDVLLREAFQERNDLLGRTPPVDWRTVVRDVPGGVAVLSGPLTQRELEDLLDRALAPR
jgi:hypothetical protein